MKIALIISIFVTAAAILGWWVALLRLRRSRSEFASDLAQGEARFDRKIQQVIDERDRLLDVLGDAFLLVDEKSMILFANATARELLGSQKLIGRAVGEVFLEPRLAKSLLHCIETGEPVEYFFISPQQTSPRGILETRGTNAWLFGAARVPTTGSSSPITRLIVRDMTAQHQTEQIRKDFIANASHELRTPLVIIAGYLANLLDENLLDEPELARRFLTIMRKHSDRITRLVDDMLLVSRLESGEVNSLKFESFPLLDCIEDILERLESIIRAHQAEVEIEMSDDEILVYGDHFYWTQILFNLVENALKQNPHPGLRVAIGCEVAEGCLRIWVADNGTGIPSADVPHVFRRFYRVEKHHSQSKIKGTGLGLSIVKRAVEAHGGTITLSSIPGRETKFLIVVPRLTAVSLQPGGEGPHPLSVDSLETSV